MTDYIYVNPSRGTQWVVIAEHEDGSTSICDYISKALALRVAETYRTVGGTTKHVAIFHRVKG